MTWKPDNASLPLEQEMERKELPEEDRDELRRFAEVLQRRKERAMGNPLLPMPPGMREWLSGDDVEPPEPKEPS